jgi:hypothetical protein
VTFSNLPAGYQFTTANFGADATDSDADATTGMTAVYTLTAGGSDLTIDAGIFQPVTVTTAPVTTAPVTTAPVTTAPVTTAPVTTAPVTTAPVTTAPVTTLPCGAQLGDIVFYDTNNNGQQDAGETGVAGVSVFITDANGASVNDCTGVTVAAATTSANGMYMFSNLPAGTYKVTFSNVPAGYTFTPANVGADATDSDADPTTGMTGLYTLVAGGSDLTVDAGIYKPAVATPAPVVPAAPAVAALTTVAPTTASATVTTVTTAATVTTVVSTSVAPTTTPASAKKACMSSVVWIDANQNGVLDANEAVVRNAELKITGPNGFVKIVYTDSNGRYEVCGLSDGAYTVTLTGNGLEANVKPLAGTKITVNVNGVQIEAPNAPFPLIAESNIALTGSNSLQIAMMAFGSMLLGLALLGSLKLRKTTKLSTHI